MNIWQLTRKKIIKIVEARCRIFKLKCTKIDFGYGSTHTTMGEITALSQFPSWNKRNLLLRKGEGYREGKGGEREGNAVRGGEEKGRVPHVYL